MADPPTEDLVRTESRGAVRILTLNRPDRFNALTVDLDGSYRAALRAADADPAVRAIVVTGAGRAFCAGADLAALEALVADPDRRHFGADFGEPLRLDTPIVAAINGACVGLGLVLALMCDVRFVAEDAKLGTAFAQRGVVAEQGVGTLLRHIVGEAHARDLLLSGRIISGSEAARIGLATRAVPADEVVPVAVAYAEDIARTCSPASIAIIKAQLRAPVLDTWLQEAGDALLLLRLALRSEDFAEGIASYRERRPPQFLPRPR